MSYYVARGGQQYGPYTEELVRSYLGAGSLSASDNIREESSAAWTTIGQLFQVPGTPTPTMQLGMEGYPSMSLERHEYRLKGPTQTLYLALGAFLGVGGGIFFASGAAGGAAPVAGGNWMSSAVQSGYLFVAIFVLIGCYYAALALRSRVVLDGTHISLRYAIREKSADLSEIKGYRIWSMRGTSYWRLEFKERPGHISIMTTFQVDDSFGAFLSQLKNLDDQ
jgi:hypothetical protein